AQELRRELVTATRTLNPARPIADLVRELPGAEEGNPERAPTITIPETAPRRRKRRPFLRKVILGLLAVLAMAAGAWAVWTYLIPHTTHVPRVLGISVSQAGQRLDAAGLDTTIGKSQFSSTAAEGKVAEVDPSAGTAIRRGSAVVLHPSRGPRFVEIPKVQGLPFSRAKAALADANLQLGEQKHRYSDTVKRGEIISQQPPAKGNIESGTKVDLLISKGPQPVDIPKVEGNSVTSATALLHGLGLQVQRVDQFDNQVPFGDVIHVVPKPGATARRGDSVTLYVSKGPKTFSMPDVKGLTPTAATAKLQSMGLHVVKSVAPNSAAATVVGQNPAAGSTVRAGSQVTIFA
ncbi:MAG: PASTA domain-containing protein, partial [Actinomycetota bacterium]|nr:PASTA domain-containing protein [Actinomycetota bacterium]